MLSRRLTGLAWNDRDTRVLLAAVILHDRRPPVTPAAIDDYLGRPGRRNVERALTAIEEAGLVAFHPGRPRTVEPLLRRTTWAPAEGLGTHLSARIAARRSTLRGSGCCDHPLTSRWGRLCTACGEPVDNAGSTDVSSTAV